MRIAKIIAYVLAGGALLLILLVVGAVVVLSYIDFNRHKPLIADAMRTATGRELAIAGDLAVEISLSPGIVAEGVTLSNAEWGSRPEMVTAERLEIHIEAMPLIYGSLQIRRIELAGADVLLETDRKGRANFDFSRPGAEAQVPEKPVEGDAAMDLLPLTSEMRIVDSRLLYTNAVTGATFTADIESLVLRDGGPAAPLTLASEGNINATPVRVSAKLGGPAGLTQPGGKWPVELYVDGAAKLAVRGSAADPFVGGGLDLAVSVSGDRTGALSELAGMAIPELGAYSLSGRVTGDVMSEIHVAGLQAQFGASDVAGDAKLDLAGSPRAVAATLVSRRLELDGLGIGVSATLRDTATSFALHGAMLAVDRFETNLSGAHISASGTVADVVKLAGLELAVSGRGDRFDDLTELAGRPLPALGSYALTGRVSGDLSSAIEISGLAVQLGASDATGGITMMLTGEHPAVAARLRSRTIDLAAFSPLRAPLRDASAVLSLKDKQLSIESFKAKLSGAAVTAKGSIAEPPKAAGLDLTVGATGAQLADLSELAGHKMPTLGSYAVSARLSGDAMEIVRASDIVARVGKSDFKGAATVRLDGARPLIDANLASDSLDLAPILGSVGNGTDAPAPPRATGKLDRLFPDDPLSLTALTVVDLRLRYSAVTVLGGRKRPQNATLDLSLHNGLLDVGQIRAELFGGTLDGAAQIDARSNTIGLDGKLELHGINVGPILAQTNAAGTVEGRINLDLDATGEGRSIRDIMAGLDGTVHLAMGKGRVRSKTLQRWVGGPTQILSNVLTLNVGGYATINCALGSFDIKQGLATSKGLLLDTDVAAFLGTGTVNLKTEALDIVIRPAVKRMTLSAAVPVRIRGTLMAPKYSLDEKAVARRVGGLLGGIVFPPAVILGLGELGTFREGDCVGAKAAAEDQGQPQQTEQTTEQKPTRLPGKLIEGTGESITRGLRRLFGQ